MTVSDSHHTDSAIAPSVGIFWRVPDDAGGQVFPMHSVPLTEAEAYGDCLTDPCGHFEVWDGWRRGATRSAIPVPSGMKTSEYEDHPRGRIVFHQPDETFWLYADRRLHRAEVILEIKKFFGITNLTCVVRSDAHYR